MKSVIGHQLALRADADDDCSAEVEQLSATWSGADLSLARLISGDAH